MASIKTVILTSKTTKEGSPVVIQINHQYKTRRRTLFSIDPKYFLDGKISRKHRDHVKLNNRIRREVSLYQDRIDRLDLSGIPYHVDDILVKEVKMPQLLTDLVTAYSERQRDLNKVASYETMRELSAAIKEFDPRMRVNDVNVAWIDRFVNALRNKKSITKDSTVGKYIKNLKTTLRSDLTNYFNKSVFQYKIPKSEPETVSLTLTEMMKWQYGEVPENLVIYRDFFTFMVHCQGPRVSDALMAEYSHISHGVIRFRELKTGARKSSGKLKMAGLNPTLEAIINNYKGMSPYYIFPFLEMPPDDPKVNAELRKHINSKTSIINHNLKKIAAHLGIEKRITNHVARRTFATLADDQNVDIRDIQSMLNHSRPGQTMEYLDRERKFERINELAQSVLRKLG